MSKAAHLTIAVAVAAIFTGLSSSAMAQQPGEHPGEHQQQKKPPPGQPGHPPGPPGQTQHGGPGPAAQFHGGPPGQPGQFHAAHAIGEHGYSFRGGFQGRRGIATFNERERAVWYGGHWRHEWHFGRMGYWWEVNGVWYYYDQPFGGPPEYVSEVEFYDDGGDPGAPVEVVQPAPVVVAPVVVAPRPVYVPPPPPVVCVGPLCVR